MATTPISRSDRFGDIRPRRYRGGGGFSDVYEGVTTSGKRVALKVFRSQDNQSAKEIEKLNREKKVLERINSRGVAKYYDSNFENDPPWIASEYIDGPTLREAIEVNGLMDAQSTELLIYQISSTLADIHQENIAHRDLSPNNVILGPDGPVIIDFGSSRLTDSSKGLVSILTSGTPGYLSPEAEAGSDASTPSDVFAIAKIAGFALTGESDASLSEELNQLSPNLAQMLSKALEANPSRRPTAQEIMDICTPDYENLKKISAASFPDLKLKKIPLRIRFRTVSAIAIAAAMLGFLTFQWFREKPVTTDSLMEYISKQVPADAPTKYKTVTRDGGAIRKFDIPENFIQERSRVSSIPSPSFYDVDAILITPDSETGETYLHIKSKIVPESGFSVDEIIQEKNLRLTDDRWTNISDWISYEGAILQYGFPKGCEFVTPKFLTLDPIKQSITAVIVTKDCEYDNKPWHEVVAVSYFPEKNLTVVVAGFYDPREIDLNKFIQSIEVTPDPILVVKSDAKSDLLTLGQYKNETGKLLYRDSTTEGYFYARTAIRLLKGQALRLKFLETQEDNYSAWGLIVDDEVDNPAIPMGRIWTFKDSGSVVFSNTQFDELIVIIELDSWGESRPLIQTDFVSAEKRSNVYDASMVDLDVGTYNADESFSYAFDKEYFSLPIDPEYKNRFATKEATVNGIKVDVPSNWVEKAISSSTKTQSENAFFALYNSGSPSYNRLEEDLPHISITDEDLAEAQSRKDGWNWLESDNFSCRSSQRFSFDSYFFHVEWTVLLNCFIPDAFNLRSSADEDQQQAAPLFRILVTDPISSVGPLEYVKPRLRINFVPETQDDLEYLKEMILSLRPSN